MSRFQVSSRVVMTAMLLSAPVSAQEGTKPPDAAPADAVIEKLGHGQVDWSSKVLRIAGSGAPNAKLPNVAAIRLNAESSARLAAFRNVIDALKGIRISEQEVASARLGQSLVRGQVEAIVQDCKTVDTRYFSDGGVDVEIECPLDGALAYALAPPKETQLLPEGGDAKYTGLIIDTTEAPAAFALAPRVLVNQDVVYGQGMVKTKLLRRHGSASYFRTVDAAKASERVGAQPLVIKGRRLQGTADVVISPEDAAVIAGASRQYLTEGRVAIVVGP